MPTSPGSDPTPDGALSVAARPAGRLEDFRCSVQARLRGDSPVATASAASRWLLVEQAGPWGRDALTQSRLDRRVAAELARRSRAEGVRLLLIRRPGGRRTDAGRRWAYADARPGREGLWWSVRAADDDLLDVPWDGSVGEPATGPTYLVCTHGSHDACCALRGRPLARALPVDRPAAVWECSHLGGDRFAANVVVLPHGFYYGHVRDDGADVVTAHEAGRVALPWLRGRAGLAAPVQAAQHAARLELGLLGVDDLAVLDVRPLPPPGDSTPRDDVEQWAVSLRGPGGTLVVTVESRSTAEAARLTCRAVHPAHARTWRSVALEAARAD